MPAHPNYNYLYLTSINYFILKIDVIDIFQKIISYNNTKYKFFYLVSYHERKYQFLKM